MDGNDLHLIDYDDDLVYDCGLNDDQQINRIEKKLKTAYQIDRDIIANFINGPRIEIKEDNNIRYNIEFIDKKNNE